MQTSQLPLPPKQAPAPLPTRRRITTVRGPVLAGLLGLALVLVVVGFIASMQWRTRQARTQTAPTAAGVTPPVSRSVGHFPKTYAEAFATSTAAVPPQAVELPPIPSGQVQMPPTPLVTPPGAPAPVVHPPTPVPPTASGRTPPPPRKEPVKPQRWLFVDLRNNGMATPPFPKPEAPKKADAPAETATAGLVQPATWVRPADPTRTLFRSQVITGVLLDELNSDVPDRRQRHPRHGQGERGQHRARWWPSIGYTRHTGWTPSVARRPGCRWPPGTMARR